LKDWAVNQPQQLARVLATLEQVQATFNAGSERQVSLADLIVLAGGVGVEQAAKAAGHDISVPFTPGRTDATAEQTDVASFAVLEPVADGFRNYLQKLFSVRGEHLLLDKAQQLTLTAPEMTVLVGGLRVLGATVEDSRDGVLTHRVGTLSNDFFVNLLDMGTQWKAVSAERFVGTDRRTGTPRWTATRTDLVFGSHAVLRALAEVYGSGDGEKRFVTDFVAAWTRVMELDRYDLHG